MTAGRGPSWSHPHKPANWASSTSPAEPFTRVVLNGGPSGGNRTTNHLREPGTPQNAFAHTPKVYREGTLYIYIYICTEKCLANLEEIHKGTTKKSTEVSGLTVEEPVRNNSEWFTSESLPLVDAAKRRLVGAVHVGLLARENLLVRKEERRISSNGIVFRHSKKQSPGYSPGSFKLERRWESNFL